MIRRTHVQGKANRDLSPISRQGQLAPRSFSAPEPSRDRLATRATERAPCCMSFADIDILPRIVIQPKLALGPAGSNLEGADLVQRESSSDLDRIPKERTDAPPNRTGMPHRLKWSIESLSGLDLSSVRVHYRSPKPAQLNALAYTQGREIHVAPGQERHLPHEAWHIVQQAQGRVRPTMQLREGVAVNDDRELEEDADRMGRKAETGVFAVAGKATQRVGECIQNKKMQPNLPDACIALLRPMWLKSADHAIQCQKHAFIGTMIHHAPPAENDQVIDEAIKVYYTENDVIASHRGEIKAKGAGSYEWGFNELTDKIVAMRAKAQLQPNDFPVIINANRMISPGEEKGPQEYVDEPNEVYAFSSVWGMNFKKPGERESSTYSEILNAWKQEADPSKNRARKTKKMEIQSGEATIGNKAIAFLRAFAKEKVKAKPNDAIPHRGLRNLFFQHPRFNEKLHELEVPSNFVHIMTLDSDVDLGVGEVLEEIKSLAEEHLASVKVPTSGLHITATDYVYKRDDLFYWLAGAMDKVGRKVMEKKGYDAYPAEPGLTISYSSTTKESAHEFLLSQPFGPEYSGDPREGRFKELVDSAQSVEGKNLRERWRKLLRHNRDPIYRTTAYVNVQESDSRMRGHDRMLKLIWEQYHKKEEISSDLIQALVSSDSYHSLAPDRNDKEKRNVQEQIVKEVTGILNDRIKHKNYPTKPDGLLILKAALIDALAAYMNK